MELIQHESWSKVLKVEDTVNYDKNESHLSERLVAKEIQNTEFLCFWRILTLTLSFVCFLCLPHFLNSQVRVLVSIELGDVEQLFVCLFSWVFGDDADGSVLEENYEKHSYCQDGNPKEDEHHNRVVGNQEEPQDIAESSDAEDGCDDYLVLLSLPLLHQLSDEDVGQVVGNADPCSQQEHPQHSQPVTGTQSKQKNSRKSNRQTSQHYHFWPEKIANEESEEESEKRSWVEDCDCEVELCSFLWTPEVSEFVGEGRDGWVSWDKGSSLLIRETANMVKALLRSHGGVADIVVLEEEEGSDKNNSSSVEWDGTKSEKECELILPSGSYFLNKPKEDRLILLMMLLKIWLLSGLISLVHIQNDKYQRVI